ncbi:MAG: Xaa-Pro peptidase family protein [Candidatus Omnitrophota bacterium]
MDYIKRQKNLITLLEKHSLDALLVKKEKNIAYLTGVKGESSLLICSKDKFILVTDPRYMEEYAPKKPLYRLNIIKGAADIYTLISSICSSKKWKNIGFESHAFTYDSYIKFKKSLSNAYLKARPGLIEKLRAIKDTEEIRALRNACNKGVTIMNYAMKALRPSLTEKDVKFKIDSFMIKRSFIKAGFDIIVASGKNSSKPHAAISDKRLKNGEMALIDLGAMSCGYNSDLTRTIYLGRIDRKYLKLYNIVLDAQKKAIESIRPGLKASYIDNISRNYINHKGLGRYFIHSLGHGIGLEVHENPSISKNSNAILEENMAITIEPGLYIPGWGGIRIEDDILITNKGCEVLTKGCNKTSCR